MEQQSDKTELRRTIGRWQLLFYGLGSMLGAGIYTLIDETAGLLGSALWAAFATAMVAALLTGLTYASLGSRYPRAGGAAYVTQHAFKIPLLSYVVGITVMMSGLTSMATGTQAIAENFLKGYYRTTEPAAPAPVSDLAPGSVETKAAPSLANSPATAPTTSPAQATAGSAAPDKIKSSPLIKPIAIVLVLMIGAVLVKGIKESMIANIICTIVEAAGLIFIIIVGFKYWGSVNYLELPPGKADAGSAALLVLLFNGVMFTFFSFIGFEDILNVSEEVKEPEKTVPFGLIGAMIAATVIYMAVAITAVSVVPHTKLAASATPLMDVAHTAAPWFTGIDLIYLVITIFAIGNTALLNYLMGSRLLYGMSRQGLLPQVLGTVHAHTGTPVVAIICLFVIVTLLILSGTVGQLAEATVLLLLSVFVAMNVGLMVLKMRKSEPKGSFEIPFFVPLLGAIVCGVLVAYRAYPAFTEPGKWVAPVIAAGIIAVAGVLYFVIAPKTVVEEATLERDL